METEASVKEEEGTWWPDDESVDTEAGNSQLLN